MSWRFANDLLVRAQEPGEPLQILGLFSIRPLVDGHSLNRFVLKGQLLKIIFEHWSAASCDAEKRAMRNIFTHRSASLKPCQ